ncbi:integrating conjugative element protein%2C PFL_4705 family [Yersinia bercovieri]|nr:integrating conjugative element protein%2C PFL_4705 family [Yersinia bercovieri]
MQIKSNTLLKVLVPVVLFIAIAIGVKSFDSGTPPALSTIRPNTVSDLTEEELQILGIEGDTPADTLRTLVARLKVIQDKQNSLDQRNTRYRSQRERCKCR